MPNKHNKRKSKGYEQFPDEGVETRDASQNTTYQLIRALDLKEITDIGEGFFANVALGKWIGPNKREQFVAIKSIKGNFLEDHLEDVLREADTMMSLDHRNIIRLYGIALITSKTPMGIKLVTEYAVFGSLSEILKNPNKPEFLQVTRLRKFSLQIADGMEYLANRHLVHRDLAARNVLVVEPELVRISDFGLAKALDQGQEITAGREMAIAWCAPEVLKGREVHPKCDVWSYGVLLWEMYSFGKRPWDGIPIMQVMKIVTQQPEKKLEQPKACPSELYELMLHCWVHEPQDRPGFAEIRSSISKFEYLTCVAKEDLWNSVQGRLSFAKDSRVTVISRSDVIPWVGQNEDGDVGTFDPKWVSFETPPHPQQKNAKEKKARQKLRISQPFNPTCRSTTRLLDDMNIPQNDEMRKLAAQSPKKLNAPAPLPQGVFATLPSPKSASPPRHTLPRPEPIGGPVRGSEPKGVARADSVNGYMPMHGDTFEPGIGDTQAPGDQDQHSVDSSTPNKSTDAPPVPARTDQTPRPERPVPAGASPQSRRRRPVPTPRRTVHKTTSSPLLDPNQPLRNRTLPQPLSMSLRYQIDESSYSDPESDHPSLVPLIGLAQSVPVMEKKYFETEYKGLRDDDMDDEEDDADYTDRGKSFENQGYAAVLYMDHCAEDDKNQYYIRTQASETCEENQKSINVAISPSEAADINQENATLSAVVRPYYGNIQTQNPDSGILAYENLHFLDIKKYTSGARANSELPIPRPANVDEERGQEFDDEYTVMAGGIYGGPETEEEDQPPSLPEKMSIRTKSTSSEGDSKKLQDNLKNDPYSDLQSGIAVPIDGTIDSREGIPTLAASLPIYETIEDVEPVYLKRMNNGTSSFFDDPSGPLITLDQEDTLQNDRCHLEQDVFLETSPPLPRKDILSRETPYDSTSLPRPLLPEHLEPNTLTFADNLDQTDERDADYEQLSRNRTENLYAKPCPGVDPSKIEPKCWQFASESNPIEHENYAEDVYQVPRDQKDNRLVLLPSGVPGHEVGDPGINHHGARLPGAGSPDKELIVEIEQPVYDRPFPTLPPPPVVSQAILNQPPPANVQTPTIPIIPGQPIPFTSHVNHSNTMLLENQGIVPSQHATVGSCSSRPAQPVDVWAMIEGSYGNAMRMIHREFPDMSMDECKKALLRYESDVDALIKVLQVCSLTGVNEEEVKFHLGHCGWDIQRTVNYIFDKMS
ncbi:uncharacterized protein LOC5513616 isoform X2 [Nematostella vectensis]|uniref:uncharacterized protein LOC5513616 isoform X2 n=1 Tax=Nematostella vectensis TaxID=45351 RepID=UPI0020775BB2|nr:uncharacterized protein LOC5513616 isoform X2 [Nematostella vectensis]